VRFYGGDPWTWLARTPQALVEAALDMLPVLRAEEAIHGAQVASTGKTLKPSRWQLQRWQTEARGAGVEVAADLASMGIKKKVVERKKK